MFKIGDRVRVVCLESRNYGVKCTITSTAFFSERNNTTGVLLPADFIHSVDLRARSGGACHYAINELELIDDGDDLEAFYDLIEWRPSEPVTIGERDVR